MGGLLILCVIVFNLPREKAPPPTRQDYINRNFSGYDGSSPKLEEKIKSTMNDPDSYEHVETRYRDDGKTIYVVTKFRGKNAFNATITKEAEGTIDAVSGDLTDWKYLD
jgi:hypothetical protein